MQLKIALARLLKNVVVIGLVIKQGIWHINDHLLGIGHSCDAK